MLLVWLLLILFQSALAISGINLAAEYLQFQMFLPLLIRLIGFLQGMVIIVIIPLLIQDDSIVGSTAFWFTRPISRKGLLFTKSCSVLILLVIPSLIAEMFVLSAHGATVYHLLLAAPEILIEKVAFIIPFAILAALTPKFGRYALVGVIIFAVFAVVGIILTVLMMFLPDLGKFLSNPNLSKNPSLEISVKVAKDIFVIIIGSVIIGYHFLTRSTRKTIIWVVIAFLVTICFPRMWHWDFLKEEVYTAKTSTVVSDSLSVDFDTQYIVVSDEPRTQKKDVRGKTISTKQTVKGLPVGQFTILRKMSDVQMEYPDETILESNYVSTHKRETSCNEKYMLPIQSVLKDVKLLNPYDTKFSYTGIFSLDESDFHKFKNKTGTYSARAKLDIYEYKIVAQVPLKPGSMASFGSERLVVYDVLARNNAISVIVNEKKIKLLFDRSVKKKSRNDMAQDVFSEYSHVYLIVNKKRNEAFLAEEGGITYANAMAALGPTRIETMAKQFDFTNLNDRNEHLPEIDKEWLADAELVRLDAVKRGKVKINFTVDDFALPSQASSPSEKIDDFDQQLKMQDRKMKQRLPQ